MVVMQLFDSSMRVRANIVRGVSECIHSEDSYTLVAEIPITFKAEPGEYLGFLCVDGRYRVFEIDDADDDETVGTTSCTCTDAALSELGAAAAQRVSAQSVKAGEAAASVLAGTAWEIDDRSASAYTTTVGAFIATIWPMLRQIAEECAVRVTPHYEFDGQKITRRVVTIEDTKSEFRGRIFENGVGASGVTITRSGSPRPIVYGLGATNENGEQLTFADVEWSVAKGDPADKPLGQTWIGMPEAVSRYPGRAKTFELVSCTDAHQLLRLTWMEAQRSATPSIRASALVSDMEMAQGQSYKAIRLYDAAAIRTRRGDVFLKTIVGIERNYVRPWETRLTLGEENDPAADIRREMAKVQAATVRAGRAGSGAGAAAVKNYLLLEAVEAKVDGAWTEINHVGVELDAVIGQLGIYAERQELEPIKTTIKTVEANLNSINTTLTLKAEKTELEKVDRGLAETDAALSDAVKRITSAEIILNGDDGDGGSSIGLVARVLGAENGLTKVSDELSAAQLLLENNGITAQANLGARVKNAESGIADANAIFKANGLTASTKIGARLNSAEGAISSANAIFEANGLTAKTRISSRVGDAEAAIELKVDPSGVAYAMNNNRQVNDKGTTIKLSAGKVDLGNYATVGMLSATEAEIEKIVTGSTKATLIKSANITADGANITSMSYGDPLTYVLWKEATVVTGGDVYASGTTRIDFLKPDGTEGGYYVPSSFSFSPKTTKIKYLGS